MDLTARAAARLLNVDEDTIHQWIANGTIPSYRVGDKTRLNRVELMEWAASRKHSVATKMFQNPGASSPKFVLSDAVSRGGVIHELACNDKLSALSAVCQAMPLPDATDREELNAVLVARESLCSTGIGEGIAIPHPRGPIVLGVSEPQVTVAFPRKPIAFDALDGQPVHTLFVIVSTTVRVHLLLLSHLMLALKSDRFKAKLTGRASQEDLLKELRKIEEGLSDTAAQGDTLR